MGRGLGLWRWPERSCDGFVSEEALLGVVERSSALVSTKLGGKLGARRPCRNGRNYLGCSSGYPLWV